MSKIKKERLEVYKNSLKFLYTKAKSESNSINAALYSSVLDINKTFEPIIRQVSVLSDMVLDLKLLNKDSNNKFSVLNKEKVFFNKDIELTSNRIELKKSNEEIADINAIASSIRSFKDISIVDKSNKLSSLSEMLRYKKIIKIDHSSIGFDTTVVLKYNTAVDINNIEIDLGELVEVYPELSSVSYLTFDNKIENILINGEQTFRFNNKLSKNNLYKLSIDPIRTRELNLTFSSSKYSYFELESIKTSYNSYAESGEIILGPFVTDSPVLKASLEGNKTEGCILFISSNTPDNWIPFETVQSVNFDNKTKVGSFNTINNASFKTEVDVTRIYVRVILNSTIAEVSNKNFAITSEQNRTTLKEKLIQDKYSEYEQEKYHRFFGGQTFIQNGVVSEVNLRGVKTLKLDGVNYLKGLVETDYSYTSKSKMMGNITIGSSPWKVSQAVLDADKLDVTGKIYSVRIEEIENVEVLESDTICIPLIVPEGLYTVETINLSLKVDCYTPYLTDTSAATVFVPYEDVIIRDQTKNIVKYIKKEELFTVKDLSNKDVYFISLIGTLYKDIEIQDLTLDYLYPLKPIGENKYAIEDSKIITNKSTVLVTKGAKLIKNIVLVDKVVNYTNGNFIQVDKNVLPSYFKDKITTSTQVVNLSKIGILKGSIDIQSTQAESEIKYNPDLTPIVNYINIGNNAPINVTDTNFLEV